ncbi:MAG: efflux RND transporter periplasmic adaptor subunit [Desulfobacterales bacterium]|jgi:membrane fusion protein (multidrug efflux system)|nr:efflux RND transporter periplasmic adaptor subunit [Desulfobacterales bacterium]
MSQSSNAGQKGKTVAVVLLTAGVVVLVALLVWFIHFRLRYAVSDAVFIRTDSLATLGFDRVSGRIIKMEKKEGDPVHKDEIIAQIDDVPYRLEAKRLESEILATRKKQEEQKLLLARLQKETALGIKIAAAKVDELKKQKKAMDAKAVSIQALIDQLERDRKRFETLYKAKVVAKQKAENISTQLSVQDAEKKAVIENATAIEASINSARLDVLLAEAKHTQIEEIRQNIQALSESIKGLSAALENEKRNISACLLRSSIDGRVAKQYVSPGDIVSPTSAIYAVLDPKSLYVVALLEENKLKGVTPGDSVNITVDAYPDRKYKGVVRQVLPASAATFALAPRDISAGEFTKVAQRIPIRIDITQGDISVLQVGLSGGVEIRREGT